MKYNLWPDEHNLKTAYQVCRFWPSGVAQVVQCLRPWFQSLVQEGKKKGIKNTVDEILIHK
jgi:hypothetical protein